MAVLFPKLYPIPDISNSKRTQKKLKTFLLLLEELKRHQLSDLVIENISEQIIKVNSNAKNLKLWRKSLLKVQSEILCLVRKEHGLYCVNHFRTQWMAIGMVVFGLPMGTAFSTSIGNMAFIGIGIPIGLAIGLAIGMQKDKDVQKAGKQLKVEIEP